MIVDNILRAKGANVETARPDWTVLQAAQKLPDPAARVDAYRKAVRAYGKSLRKRRTKP